MRLSRDRSKEWKKILNCVKLVITLDFLLTSVIKVRKARVRIQPNGNNSGRYNGQSWHIILFLCNNSHRGRDFARYNSRSSRSTMDCDFSFYDAAITIMNSTFSDAIFVVLMTRNSFSTNAPVRLAVLSYEISSIYLLEKKIDEIRGDGNTRAKKHANGVFRDYCR